MKKHLLVLFSILGLGNAFCQTPAYTQTNVMTGLNYPVAFDIAPDGRFFITQKGGNSAGSCANGFIKVYDANGVFLTNFYDLTDSVQCDFERGLLGICLDPDFTNNHYVYAYYNHLYAGDERIRVVRFTENANLGTNPFLVFDLDVSNSIPGNHVGGNIRMHPSEPDKIYITIGDLAYQQGNTTNNYAQKLTLPYGKILRVNTDGTVPTTNPFYDDGDPFTGNCDWIWSYGHRNAFDMSFSPVNDSLYSSENGWQTWDEVNQISRGNNYGWNTCEGNFLNGSTTTPCSIASSILPIEDWGTTLPAVTGILHYSGTAFSSLDNHLLVADNSFGRIYDITVGNPPAWNTFVSRSTWADFTTGGLTTIKEGTDECIYAMKGGYTTNGIIYRICPLGMNIEENISEIGNIGVFPNPAADNFSVVFSVKEDAKIKAEFFDVTGRMIGTTPASEFKKGKVYFNVNKNNLAVAKGIVFGRISVENADGKITTGRIKVVLE
ncbi:MAG: PQQ-dependent sugar dehydrogenase [Bacteroidia bacterium]|nr:PQQ-dependent sugar dehydrogenase [Bacteroidia bacterium]